MDRLPQIDQKSFRSWYWTDERRALARDNTLHQECFYLPKGRSDAEKSAVADERVALRIRADSTLGLVEIDRTWFESECGEYDMFIASMAATLNAEPLHLHG